MMATFKDPVALRTAKLRPRVTDLDLLQQLARPAAAGYLYEPRLGQHPNGRSGLDDPMFDLIGVNRYCAIGGRTDADPFGEFDDVVLDLDKLQIARTERMRPPGLPPGRRALLRSRWAEDESPTLRPRRAKTPGSSRI